jgi:hypothetical protein
MVEQSPVDSNYWSLFVYLINFINLVFQAKVEEEESSDESESEEESSDEEVRNVQYLGLFDRRRIIDWCKTCDNIGRELLRGEGARFSTVDILVKTSCLV